MAAVAINADEPSDPIPDAGLAVALSLEQVFIDVAERVSPGVVAIRGYRRSGVKTSGASADGWTATENDRYPDHARRTVASGFFVSDDGYIVTTSDAVQHPDDVKPVDLVEVEFGQQVWVRGRIVGIEPTINLAVIKIDSPLKLTPLVLADSDKLRIGQWAIALGDPDGAERTFAVGVVSQNP